MRRACLVPLAVVACCALASPATAAFHLMRIYEVYGGGASHPEGQYVELRMCNAGQNFVGGHSVHFLDAAGGSLGSVTFPGAVGNGASQARILIATAAAELAFGVTADLRMPPLLLAAGGKVCFDPPATSIDCFAWGAYSALPDPTVGNPFDPAGGLPVDAVVVRDLTVDGDPTLLECLPPGANDDTDDSAADFDSSLDPPAPDNNDPGDPPGELDPALVFLHGFETGSTAGWSLP